MFCNCFKWSNFFDLKEWRIHSALLELKFHLKVTTWYYYAFFVYTQTYYNADEKYENKKLKFVYCKVENLITTTSVDHQ